MRWWPAAVLVGAMAGHGLGQDAFFDRALPRETEAGRVVLADPAGSRLQVLVAEIVSGDAGRPSLRWHAYRVGEEYFYPASTVKLCGAVTALETLNLLSRERGVGVGLDTPMTVRPLVEGGEAVTTTVGLEIRKLFLVSDNGAFNRLYDLVGHRRLNTRMWELGLGTRITHRLSIGLPAGLQRRSPEIAFETGDGRIVVPARTSDLAFEAEELDGYLVGTGFMSDGVLVPGPVDFTHKNRASLRDLQELLVMVVRPDIDLGRGPLYIDRAQRRWLLEAMTGYPGDSIEPVYDREHYPDEYCKYLLPGLERVVPKARLRVANKVGMAYGFTVENAYVEDTATGRAFFLAACVYTNADGVLNDDRYEYETVALPFMADLGEAVARELLAE